MQISQLVQLWDLREGLTCCLLQFALHLLQHRRSLLNLRKKSPHFLTNLLLSFLLLLKIIAVPLDFSSFEQSDHLCLHLPHLLFYQFQVFQRAFVMRERIVDSFELFFSLHEEKGQLSNGHVDRHEEDEYV